MKTGPRILESVEQAAEILLAGDLVAIPTETVYGLAADSTNLESVARVFQLKGRPADHPLIVHCSSAEQAWECTTQVTDAARKLANEFWPGPLTMILNRGDSIDLTITGGQDSVAVRVPSHPLTLELLKAVDRPLVAPSANRFGRVSPTSAEHVLDEFKDADLWILDGGPCRVGIESTIVDCRNDSQLNVLRPGKVSASEVFEIAGQCSQVAPAGSPSVRVSGSLPSHYSPDAKVILAEPGQILSAIKAPRTDIQIMVISPASSPTDVSKNYVWKTVSSNPNEFAQQMYSLLREADRIGCEQVIIEMPSADGIGVAIRDRLIRASAE